MTCEHLGHFKEIHLSLDAFPNMCSATMEDCDKSWESKRYPRNATPRKKALLILLTVLVNTMIPS